MICMKKWMTWATAAIIGSLAAQAEVVVRQDINLRYGWNAVYVEVAPTQSPDELFASWPVKSVGFYDPASFLSTRQFAQDWDSRGSSLKPVIMWHRDLPELSQVKSIPAGVVCLVCSTNQENTTVSLVGVPAAPRMTWHITNTNEVYNFVGFSLRHGESIAPADYLEGFPGNFLTGGLHKFTGRNPDEPPSIKSLAYGSDTVSDGDVLLVASDVQSDWSGVLHVSPMEGPDFGSVLSKVTLNVRNDGSAERTVAVELETSASYGDLELPRAAIYIRDAAVALTNAAWAAIGPASTPVATKRLAAGETWSLEFGIDRPSFDTGAKGRKFGALLRVTDVDGRSRMRVEVPLVGETSGATANRTWPGGLWLADVALNRIIAPGDTAETETGGTVKLRLPVHIDEHGTVRLLQRVVTAGDVAEDGTYTYRLYAGTAKIPATASQVMRISAVCLPTEIPVVEATTGSVALSSPSADIAFAFTVAGDGATSLLRHPLHPQHDGLRWDFTTPAPSGDDFQNYKGDVKPETFSVDCRIELALDMNGGETAWNPENTKSGTCRWTFSNLMRQGDITLLGPMSIKRISPLSELVLE
jgi:hypothetical protein